MATQYMDHHLSLSHEALSGLVRRGALLHLACRDIDEHFALARITEKRWENFHRFLSGGRNIKFEPLLALYDALQERAKETDQIWLDEYDDRYGEKGRPRQLMRKAILTHEFSLPLTAKSFEWILGSFSYSLTRDAPIPLQKRHVLEFVLCFDRSNEDQDLILANRHGVIEAWNNFVKSGRLSNGAETPPTESRVPPSPVETESYFDWQINEDGSLNGRFFLSAKDLSDFAHSSPDDLDRRTPVGFRRCPTDRHYAEFVQALWFRARWLEKKYIREGWYRANGLKRPFHEWDPARFR